MCPKPKERAIHDLVLLKAITAKDNPTPDITTMSNAPPDAHVFLCSILEDDPELFKNFPEERQAYASSTATEPCPQVATLMPQDDATFLQASADAMLNKVHKLRHEEPRALNPDALPFTPLPSTSPATDHCLVTTIAEIHPQPKEVFFSARDETPQPTSVPPTAQEPPNTKRVRWQPELTIIHEIETEGKQKPTSVTLLQQREHASKKRTWCTNRSKRYRDQLVDWVITLHQLHALNSHTEPQCPSPRLIINKPKRTILQNPNKQESASLPKPIPKGNAKPLTQRMAEYTQHKARIFNQKLRPGVFNFHFFPP